MKSRLLISIMLAAAAFASCSVVEVEPEPEDLPEIGKKEKPSKSYEEGSKYGITYIYDDAVIPQIHLSVSSQQWNALLKLYDANHKTRQYIHCDATYVKGDETTVIKDAGLRLKGNTSRRHPGSKGSYHHVHFGLNFREFTNDDAHEVHGAGKINLKWFNNDPTYVREVYCYDLFRRDTVWTAVHAAYCRLFLKVEGDAKETYLGIYQMQEPIDRHYLKERQKAFEGASGNLWKCRYGATLAATDDKLFGLDTGTDQEWVYECKTEENDFNGAKAQFKDFISKAKNKTGKDFHDWFASHCDVPLLLRTYAVNVACGMWDDYWNNCNNYYVYFNSTDVSNYKFYFIPYDYDNTLGTCSECGVQKDAAKQDPLNWGSDNNYLIKKILGYDDWRELYKKYLLQLASDKGNLLDKDASAARIAAWQEKIRKFVPNDTGEDMAIEDRPASWGNHKEYRLLENSSSNYFKVKIESILKYCK